VFKTGETMIRPKPPTLLLISIAAFYSAGCDTCNDGLTFINPTLSPEFSDAGEGLISLTIEWETGEGLAAELPDAYFEAAEFQRDESSGWDICLAEDDAGLCLAAYESLDYSDTNQYTATFTESVINVFAGSDFSFSANLPDRRQHVDCRHPGADDSTTLTATVTLDEAGAIIDSTIFERVDLGPI